MKRTRRRLAERPSVAVIETTAQKPHPRAQAHDVRGRQDQMPPRLQDPPELPQVSVAVLEVLDALDRQHGVERFVIERKRSVEIGGSIRRAEDTGSRRSDIDAEGVVAVAAQCGGPGTLAARGVEHGGPATKLEVAEGAERRSLDDRQLVHCASRRNRTTDTSSVSSTTVADSARRRRRSSSVAGARK